MMMVRPMVFSSCHPCIGNRISHIRDKMNNIESTSYGLAHCCIDTKGSPYYTSAVEMETRRPDYPLVQGAYKPQDQRGVAASGFVTGVTIPVDGGYLTDNI